MVRTKSKISAANVVSSIQKNVRKAAKVVSMRETLLERRNNLDERINNCDQEIQILLGGKQMNLTLVGQEVSGKKLTLAQAVDNVVRTAKKPLKNKEIADLVTASGYHSGIQNLEYFRSAVAASLRHSPNVEKLEWGTWRYKGKPKLGRPKKIVAK